MNRHILTKLASQAALMSPLVDNYPDKNNLKVTFPPSPYYRFLLLLADEIKLLAVELGVCGGGGSLHMAMARSRVNVVGIDISLDYEDNIAWITKHYSNYTFLQGDSVQLAQMVYDKFGQIGLLFIDTTHTYEQTMAEYNAYLPFLADSCAVCLDDLFRPGMDMVWDEMPDNKERFDFLHPSQSPTDGGFGVVWR